MNKLFSFTIVTKTVAFAKAHKVISAIILAAALGVGWWVHGALTSGAAESYVFATVTRGTVVASVSASGQVSASNQVDLNAQAAGELVYLNAQAGQTVAAGTLIGQIDATDAAFELESSKISYQDLTTIDPKDLASAQTDAQNAHTDARTTLISVSSTFTDTLQTIDDLFSGYLGYKQGRSNTAQKYIDTAQESYNKANDAIHTFRSQYQVLGNSTEYTDIETLTQTAHDTALVLLQAAKDAKDAVAYIRARDDASNATEADAAYTSVNGAVTDASTMVSDLVSAQSAMTNANNALTDLEDGPSTLDLRSAQLDLNQKEQTYADHFIRAPFSGIIASVPVQKGDTLSNGTTVATLITKQKVAELSLNEVDAAKISVGQKATLTFDAIEGLTLTGTVSEVDLVGTVSQGVVSYTVKIAFDSEDTRVKPGMTVNASIQTDVAQDVLIVPSSAVKTQQGSSYVQVVAEDGSISSVPVETGITDDINVEITSGLTEGEQVVERTVSSTQSNQSQSSGFGGARAIRF